MPEVRRLFRPEREPVPEAGGTVEAAPEVRLRCLFPPAGWQAGTADDRCAVFLLECRGVRVLFMNDAGFVTEKFLLESGESLRADVLVKGRHGSDYSGLPEFLRAVQPRAVIYTNSRFPAGEDPGPEWREMLADRGIRGFDQAVTGAVTIRIGRRRAELSGFCDHSHFVWLPEEP